MNLSKLTKANLIQQLEQRSLATDGLKDELVKRLKEAMEKESVVEIDNQEENYDSEDEDNQNYENKADNDDKENPAIVQESSDAYLEVNETLNDDEIVKDGDSTTVLTVEDAINMKSTNAPESCSMIVNIDDDDTAVSISAKEDNMDYDQSVGNRDTDNGDHEVIEINEEVVIDDEDNQDNDNNFNEQSLDNDQTQEDKDELENGESRDNESGEEEEKVNLWVHNVSEDVKALELKELFSKYGKVVSAKVVTNSKTATGNCFGCIQLSNEEDAQNCIKNLDKTEFRGQTIVVSKELNDVPPKEKIQRMVSPISSSGSWGGGKNRSPSVKSLSPFVGEIPKSDSAKEDNNKNDQQEERSNYRPPYRGRGGYRGGNSSGQSGGFAPRNYNRYDGQDNRGQSRQDYSRPTGGGDRRGGYGSSRQERDSGDSRPPYRSGGAYEGRPRDAYVPREDHSGKYDGARYGQGGRDRYEYAPGGSDRASRGRRYYEEDGGRSSGRYEQDYDDRRSSYRPRVAPTDRDRDYVSSRRDEVPFKRPRADHGDDRDPYSAAAPKKARGGRDEYEAPRLDRYHSSPPPAAKRSFYNERQYQAPSRPDYRDRDSGSRREAYPVPSRSSTRDYGSRPAYTAYSPPDERRTGGRPHGYSSSSKPYSSAADFGGRSRNYEH